jgi:hypothetical protein
MMVAGGREVRRCVAEPNETKFKGGAERGKEKDGVSKGRQLRAGGGAEG